MMLKNNRVFERVCEVTDYKGNHCPDRPVNRIIFKEKNVSFVIVVISYFYKELLNKMQFESENVQKLIETVCNSIKELLLTKNRKYGNSALNPVRIFAKIDSIESINVRIDDKLSRIKNAQTDEDEDLIMDLIGYLVLKRVAEITQNNNQISTKSIIFKDDK